MSSVNENEGCKHVYDRDISSGWSTEYDNSKEWLNISLAGVYNVSRLEIKQGIDETFKDILIEFSNNEKFNDTLPNTENWTEVRLPHKIESSFLTIRGLNFYSKAKKSVKTIHELKIFGCLEGNK